MWSSCEVIRLGEDVVQRQGTGCLCRGTRMPLFLFRSTLFWSHLERSQSLHTDPSGAKSPSQQSRGGEPAEAISEPGSRVGCCISGRASCALQPWIWGEPPTAGSSQGPGGHWCPGAASWEIQTLPGAALPGQAEWLALWPPRPCCRAHPQHRHDEHVPPSPIPATL